MHYHLIGICGTAMAVLAGMLQARGAVERKHLAGRHHHLMEDLEVPIKLQGNNPLAPIKIGEGAWIG